jgi:ubiquinone/menaquinone biosynthesis C-methylase UbiE
MSNDYLGRFSSRAPFYHQNRPRYPGAVIDLLARKIGLTPDSLVADIGAGTGYYTRRLAKAVGTNGTVFAVEIQQEMLDILTNKLTAEKIFNVKPVLGTVSDPKLPAASVDLIFSIVLRTKIA